MLICTSYSSRLNCFGGNFKMLRKASLAVKTKSGFAFHSLTTPLALLRVLAIPASVCFSFRPITSSHRTITLAACKMPAETAKYLRYVKLTPNAFSPSKGSEKAAGFDLKSAYSYVIQPHSREMVKTDLQIMLPEGCYGRVAPRSGLTWKNAIDVGAGVIDEDYRGDLRVILFNHSDDAFTIQPGDRIAQLICERIYYPVLQEVQELNETKRGSGGFGSTGIKTEQQST